MLTWTCTQQPEGTVYAAQTMAAENSELKLATEACAEKMIGLLASNIQDESLYLLFEWDKIHSTLVVVVTDASKKCDAKQKVVCEFFKLNQNLKQLPQAEFAEKAENYADWIKYWLLDYLSSCTAFLNFSLVAIFHADSRDHTELL